MDDQGDVMKKRLKTEVVDDIYMPYKIYKRDSDSE